MCYTYDTADLSELEGVHNLTGIESGDDDTMYWIPEKSKYIMFEFDHDQTYMALSKPGAKKFDVLYLVDDRRPRDTFAGVPVKVTTADDAAGKFVTIDSEETGEPVIQFGEAGKKLVMETFPRHIFPDTSVPTAKRRTNPSLAASSV